MSKYDKDMDEKYGAKLKPLTMKEGFQAWKHDNIHLFGKFGEAGIELVNQVAFNPPMPAPTERVPSTVWNRAEGKLETQLVPWMEKRAENEAKLEKEMQSLRKQRASLFAELSECMDASVRSNVWLQKED